MSKLDNAVEDLITAIRDSNEYQAFLQEKDRMNQFPELKKQIDEYRIRNYELQSMTNEEELFQQMEEFNHKYERFREDPLVSAFLEAEINFCRMMQEMSMKITAALDFD